MVRLPNPLHPECWFPFCGSILSVLFVHQNGYILFVLFVHPILSWTHSSKGYFVRKCTKLKRLSHYLIRCVHRDDFHFIEAYGLFYSCTQYWTHSWKGYLVHGPCFPRHTCLDIRKCTKFKRLSHYLMRCVHRADFHFMEAYGLYYSYTQYWTHSSKGYLVHGPCFPRYSSLDIWKCTKFKRLSHYLIRCVHRADFHFI